MKTQKQSALWERFKNGCQRVWRFVVNPRLFLCVAVAWIVTNGWSYALFALGTLLDMEWMTAVGGAYLAFLWLPVSPEKVVTVALAIVLLRWWFPNDKNTLSVLKTSYAKAKKAVHRFSKRRATPEKTDRKDA